MGIPAGAAVHREGAGRGRVRPSAAGGRYRLARCSRLVSATCDFILMYARKKRDTRSVGGEGLGGWARFAAAAAYTYIGARVTTYYIITNCISWQLSGVAAVDYNAIAAWIAATLTPFWCSLFLPHANWNDVSAGPNVRKASCLSLLLQFLSSRRLPGGRNYGAF